MTYKIDQDRSTAEDPQTRQVEGSNVAIMLKHAILSGTGLGLARRCVMAIIVGLVVCCASSVSALTEVASGIEWTYEVSNDEASVEGIPSSTTGKVVIPSTLGGCKVTSIGDWAFEGRSGLTSVTIPSGVTRIGDWAFEYCRALTSVEIPSSVTRIGDWAFSSCSGLTSVTIPSSVTRIGDWAFEYCSALTSFVVDADNPAYCSLNGLLCSKDGKVVISGVNGDVMIPEGVMTIRFSAFASHSGLTSVTIPSSVTSIEAEAFWSCRALMSFVVDGDNPEYCSLNGLLCSKDGSVVISGVNGDVTIPEGVTHILDSAFFGCRALTSVVIPSGVTNIENYTFLECSALTSVVIPSSVTNIGHSAFSGCSALTSVVIPSSVTSIWSWAFYDCDALKVVYVDVGDAGRVRELYDWPVGVSFVEMASPLVLGDLAASVAGDPVNGFVVRSSARVTAVEMLIPQEIDAAKVTVEVSPQVASAKPNGAAMKVVRGDADITAFLDIPPAVNGVVDLARASVKAAIVGEVLDPGRGAVIELNPSNPVLTTANTRKGLVYQLREGVTLDTMADGARIVGDGRPWTPPITVKGGRSAFYAIRVGK